MSEQQTSGSRNVVWGERNLYGYTIGILMIEGYFPRPPGAIGNATTFAFPVMHHVVRGAFGETTVRALGKHPPGSPAYLAAIEPWLEGARELERRGVRAITSSCGFTALFQRELTEAVSVPVFATSLLLAPTISRMLKPGAKVGVVTADGRALTERHLKGAGIDPDTIAVVGLEDCATFQQMAYEERHELDLGHLDHEVRSIIRDLIEREPTIGALLLECSLLPPYAASVQREFGLPVIDFTTMINMVHSTLVRAPFQGYL